MVTDSRNLIPYISKSKEKRQQYSTERISKYEGKPHLLPKSVITIQF